MALHAAAAAPGAIKDDWLRVFPGQGVQVVETGDCRHSDGDGLAALLQVGSCCWVGVHFAAAVVVREVVYICLKDGDF